MLLTFPSMKSPARLLASVAVCPEPTRFSNHGCGVTPAAGVPARSCPATASYACAKLCEDARSCMKYGTEFSTYPVLSSRPRRSTHPTSPVMFHGSSRWIVAVKLWVRPLSSSGSTRRVTLSPNGTVGTIGMVRGPGVGVGMGPSTPTRKAADGSVAEGEQAAPGEPTRLQRGALMLRVWPKATPICQLPRLTLF